MEPLPKSWHPYKSIAASFVRMWQDSPVEGLQVPMRATIRRHVDCLNDICYNFDAEELRLIRVIIPDFIPWHETESGKKKIRNFEKLFRGLIFK